MSGRRAITGKASGTRTRAVALAAAATMLATFWSLAPVSGAGAATPDLGETSRSTFRLLPGQDRLAVEVDISIKNHQADTSRIVPCPGQPSQRCRQTIRYVVSQWSPVIVQATARDVRFSGPGVEAHVLERQGGWVAYTVAFARIFNGQTRRIHVSYELPSGRPRSASPTRVTDAYSHFCWHGQPADTGTTTVVMPGGYETETRGGAVRDRSTPKTTTIKAVRTSDPQRFFGCTDAFDPEKLLRTDVTSPSGQTVRVEGWPEDLDWETDISRRLGLALPRIESVIGIPFPRDDVTIREVSLQALGGYGGEFSVASGLIRVGEFTDDDALVAHELAHAWFNGATLADAWAIEGLAEWVGTTTAGQSCRPLAAYPAKGKPDLGSWRFLSANPTPKDQELVAWQYAAACRIMASVADAVGPDRMREVIIGLLLRLPKYGPDAGIVPPVPAAIPKKGPRSRPPDWREFLDAVDELGLVPAGVADLGLAEHLLVDQGIATAKDLRGRAEARTAYHAALLEQLAGAMPAVISGLMDDWRFADAGKALDVALEVIRTLDGIPATALDPAVRSDVRARLGEASTLGQLTALAREARTLGAGSS